MALSAGAGQPCVCAYCLASARTSVTYQLAWLYAKIAPGRPAAVAPPAAPRYRAADGTASKGLMTSGGPGAQGVEMPHSAPVDGRNCIGPRAPAVDRPSLMPSALSICPIAASTVQGSPGQ